MIKYIKVEIIIFLNKIIKMILVGIFENY